MIILAHGLFGFGDPFAVPGVVQYFNGVAAHLRAAGLTVIEPQVNPVGSIAQRGGQLAQAILAQVPADTKAHIIAHSMGGLDARHAISHVNGVAARVATLVTVGTPHRGSPVADAIADPADPLFAHIPPMLLVPLQQNAGALHDLTTVAASQFDDATPDAKGVHYIEVAGDASQGGPELFLFQLAALIGHLTGEVNDGVVTRASALRPGREHLADWPVDHVGEIGWTLQMPLPVAVLPAAIAAPHLARYDDIIQRLNAGN